LISASTIGAGVLFIYVTGHIFYEIEVPPACIRVHPSSLHLTRVCFCQNNTFYKGDQGGQEWELFDTFWFLVITTTTVGFGEAHIAFV
jgi:hypothetical protein